MIGDRVKNLVDREPMWRRAEDMVGDVGSEVRNAPGGVLKKRVPDFENRNFGGGLSVGVVEAGIAAVIDQTLGVPFGSDTEIVDTQTVEGGMMYVVNVDAPFENMARARAFFEANTGFTSLLTDLINVENVTVARTRPLRDTYQIEVVVED